MPDQIRELRDRMRAELGAALHAAQEELRHLDERRLELLDEIARAENWLGEPAQRRPTAARTVLRVRPNPTLHQAMAIVLKEHPEGLRAGDLANEITARDLYRRKDGTPVDPHQIHARVGHYGNLFERGDGVIRVKSGAASDTE